MDFFFFQRGKKRRAKLKFSISSCLCMMASLRNEHPVKMLYKVFGFFCFRGSGLQLFLFFYEGLLYYVILKVLIYENHKNPN